MILPGMRKHNSLRFVAWIMAPICVLAFGLSACLKTEPDRGAPVEAGGAGLADSARQGSTRPGDQS